MAKGDSLKIQQDNVFSPPHFPTSPLSYTSSKAEWVGLKTKGVGVGVEGRSFQNLTISIKNPTIQIRKSDSKVLINNIYNPIEVKDSINTLTGRSDNFVINLARRFKYFIKKFTNFN